MKFVHFLSLIINIMMVNNALIMNSLVNRVNCESAPNICLNIRSGLF